MSDALTHPNDKRDQTTLKIERRQNCIWVTLPDSINMDSYDRIEERLAVLADEKPSRLVIDLGETKSMYSAGFGMIVRLKKRAESKGVGICLVNVNARVIEALTAVGLNRVLPVYEEGAALDFQ